ncbi:MAG: RNA polymerase sigma-70 factor [Bacteroidetes bacterium]|nr:RNA polymerase sigma-70 factor [Bacteroidota bacterium]
MPDNYSDSSILLERLQGNDLKAFEYLYNTSRNRLYVLALSILQDPEAARDLVQDFFIDLWHLRLFTNISSSLNAYLFQAVRNRAYNFRDKEQTLSKLKQSFLAATPETRYPLENQELGRILERAINRLPEMAGKVFRMQYIDNCTQQEISEKLGISRNTVKNHMDRALKELRSTLKKEL